MRMIDADALIDLINRAEIRYDINGDPPQETREQIIAHAWGMYKVIMEEMIYNQPTLIPPNEWVSVEERLPGVSGNYICAVKDKNGSVWTIPSEWNLEMKTWFGAFGEIKNTVTHWMPLPEPPEEGSE